MAFDPITGDWIDDPEEDYGNPYGVEAVGPPVSTNPENQPVVTGGGGGGNSGSLLDQLNAENPGWVLDANGQPQNPTMQNTWSNLPPNERYPSAGESGHGLSYWASQGVDPARDMFDANGQLRDGWVHTANGYARAVSAPSGGGGRAAAFNFSPFEFDFQYPEWQAPTAKAGDWTPPSWDVGEFSYPDYAPPTAETFQTDPGYDFRMKEMQRSIINDKSARGLRSTGGTLKELMSYAGGLASQEYGNVNNRNFQTWQANRGNALDAHRLKYGAETDEYQRGLTDYNSRRSLDQDTFGNALTSYLTGYGRESDDFNRALQTHTTNYGEASNTFGLNNNAQNDRWSQLLGLYNLASRNLPTYTPFNPGAFN